MIAAPLYDYDFYEAYDISSYVTVRHSRKSYQLTPRPAEIAGTDRQAYGGRKPATDGAASVATTANDLLRCSDCKNDVHFELFPLSTIFLHRHAIWIETKKNGKTVGKLCGRGYRCNECQKKRRDESEAARLAERLAAERGKPVKQNKKPKKQRRKSK